MIDYEAQFKDLAEHEFMAANARWHNRREYPTAKAAYQSAARTEGRGIDVAFAKYRHGYYVWTNNRDKP